MDSADLTVIGGGEGKPSRSTGSGRKDGKRERQLLRPLLVLIVEVV
jgi:hypothetical protein